MKPQVLRFLKNNQVVELHDVPSDRMLLDLIREDLSLKGSKEGCAEGDCGACTVVVGRLEKDGPGFHAINSCIRFAHSIQGQALYTVEDLRQSNGSLHPCQQSMVDHHGSQCGFCTPGFIMSMFAMYERYVPSGSPITREDVLRDLSGNLCRCTGYRPIVDAAQAMPAYPKALLDRRTLLDQLKELASRTQAEPPEIGQSAFYFQPTQLADALRARAEHPDALLVAGSTDVGLWVTKRHDHYRKIVDLSQITELLTIEQTEARLRIGASVPLSQAFSVLKNLYPSIQDYLDRYAGLPIRESATLGGNIATGSPIGDSMPLLIALNATITLQSSRGQRTVVLEDFYTGYRKNLLAADEIVTQVDIPIANKARLAAYKLSKRRDDDISIVALALCAQIREGRIQDIRIGVGGMAERPMRAVDTERALRGRELAQTVFESAAQILTQEFSPISDMRASAAYRQQVIGKLLNRFWEEVVDGQAG